jgi:hypothetical protein
MGSERTQRRNKKTKIRTVPPTSSSVLVASGNSGSIAVYSAKLNK